MFHQVVFNVVKSQCLIAKSKNVVLNCPSFQLCGTTLPYIDSYKYLGHIVNSSLSDDAGIMKQTRPLYARANMIIRKFLSASLNSKLMLFRAYCTPMYGCGVQCISILSTSYALHIMMRFDNCYRSHDGIVLLNFLFLTVFHHYRKICVNWLSLWRSLQISAMLFYLRTCFLNLQFLNVGKVVCFSLFSVFVFVCVLCVHGPRACHWRQIK